MWVISFVVYFFWSSCLCIYAWWQVGPFLPFPSSFLGAFWLWLWVLGSQCEDHSNSRPIQFRQSSVFSWVYLSPLPCLPAIYPNPSISFSACSVFIHRFITICPFSLLFAFSAYRFFDSVLCVALHMCWMCRMCWLLIGAVFCFCLCSMPGCFPANRTLNFSFLLCSPLFSLNRLCFCLCLHFRSYLCTSSSFPSPFSIHSFLVTYAACISIRSNLSISYHNSFILIRLTFLFCASINSSHWLSTVGHCADHSITYRYHHAATFLTSFSSLLSAYHPRLQSSLLLCSFLCLPLHSIGCRPSPYSLSLLCLLSCWTNRFSVFWGNFLTTSQPICPISCIVLTDHHRVDLSDQPSSSHFSPGPTSLLRCLSLTGMHPLQSILLLQSFSPSPTFPSFLPFPPSSSSLQGDSARLSSIPSLCPRSTLVSMSLHLSASYSLVPL